MCVALGLAGWWWARARHEPERGAVAAGGAGDARRPNVLLVSIDTLRADRVGAQGYALPTTPALDELASQGVRFATAYAPSSWTVPSVVSTMTGLYPSHHGVVRGYVRNGSIHEQQTVPERLPWLARLLSEQGYRTYAITANGHLDARFGFARSFDRFACVGFDDAEPVLAMLERWKGEILAGPPWFVWLHLFDPHAPYEAHEPWLSAHHAARRRFPELERVHFARSMAKMPISDDQLAYVRALYDGEIHQADRALARALSLLRAKDGAVIAVVSDHGEELKDHGSFGHGHTLYEEALRVPFVVRMPDRRFAGRVVKQRVSLVDLMPTLADLLELPAADGDGRSLAAAMRGEPMAERPVFAERTRGEPARAVIEDGWKLYLPLHHPEHHRLYHLPDDPLERTSRAADQPERVAHLRSLLGTLDHGRAEPGPNAPLTADQAAALKALGYTD